MRPGAVPRHGLVAAACAALLGGGACAQEVPPPLKAATDLAPPPGGEPGKRLPIVLRARELNGQPDLETIASGDVEFRRGALVIRADRLTYDAPTDLARATGQVRVRKDGAVYSGPELQLQVQRFEGYFLQPRYEFLRLGSGGSADRVDFIDSARAVALNARYTSCPRDGSGDPDWVLETRRVRMDFETNEGIAEGAVLRFLGVPILAAPVLSFPLTDDRITEQITVLSARLAESQSYLAAKLHAADALLASLQSQQSMLTATIDSLNYSLYGTKNQ